MLNVSVDRALAAAKSKARAGATDEARQIYRAVLTKFPSNRRAQRGLEALPPEAPVGAPEAELTALRSELSAKQAELARVSREKREQFWKFESQTLGFRAKSAVHRALDAIQSATPEGVRRAATADQKG